MSSARDLESIFGFHPAATPGAQAAHQRVRQAFLHLAEEVDEMLPEGREKSLALTALQEGSLWANASLALSRPLAEE